MNIPHSDKRFRIGASGWHYAHWRGSFYPEALRSRDMLAWYAAHFDTVELNSTFYRMPTRAAISGWLTQTPPDFRFSAKASRFTTHAKRLLGAPASFDKYFAAIEPLRERMGPVVFQLPPRFEPNVDRPREFIEALPEGWRYAFEFRDPRWFSAPTREALERAGVAFCVFEIGGARSPLWRTAEFIYIRLHGPGRKYQGEYGEMGLRPWAVRIEDWAREGAEVWCYFDNDEAGYAAGDALLLARMLKAGIPVNG